jgi:hypothetical protein
MFYGQNILQESLSSTFPQHGRVTMLQAQGTGQRPITPTIMVFGFQFLPGKYEQ